MINGIHRRIKDRLSFPRWPGLAVVCVALILLSALVADALGTWNSGYRINAGQMNYPIAIDAGGTCRTVSNSSGNAYFIPTRTAGEWNSFATYPPAGVSVAGCCVPTMGQPCGGSACVNPGTIQCNGTCAGTSYVANGTSCGTNLACNGAGACVSMLVVNSQTGQSCTQICAAGGRTCISVGTDSAGTNNDCWMESWFYQGTGFCNTCRVLGQRIGCAYAMYEQLGSTNCSGYQVMWTYCRCQ